MLCPSGFNQPFPTFLSLISVGQGLLGLRTSLSHILKQTKIIFKENLWGPYLGCPYPCFCSLFSLSSWGTKNSLPVKFSIICILYQAGILEDFELWRAPDASYAGTCRAFPYILLTAPENAGTCDLCKYLQQTAWETQSITLRSNAKEVWVLRARAASAATGDATSGGNATAPRKPVVLKQGVLCTKKVLAPLSQPLWDRVDGICLE